MVINKPKFNIGDEVMNVDGRHKKVVIHAVCFCKGSSAYKYVVEEFDTWSSGDYEWIHENFLVSMDDYSDYLRNERKQKLGRLMEDRESIDMEIRKLTEEDQ